jgi:xanthine dehydrogenase accessory factor
MGLIKQQKTSTDAIELTAESVEDEGMICGGWVELFLEPILPEDHAAVELFGRLVDLVRNGGSGTLITRVSHGIHASTPDNRMLVEKDGSETGAISGVAFIPPCHAAGARLVQPSETGPALFFEPIQQPPGILLFGAGHIGTVVSRLAKTIGFRVSVFDDRGDFANCERFPEADEIYAMPYGEVFEKVKITESSYVVIVTRGHRGDRLVLERVLKSAVSPAYIGMIGSIRKRDAVYREMVKYGISEQALSKIHSPIGLNIGAQTPEEIAISIIAEIIKVKADHAGAQSFKGLLNVQGQSKN